MRNCLTNIVVVFLFIFSGMMANAQPLNGTYAIGATQPVGFQNLTQALAKLTAQGVSDAVTFELQANYSSAGETFPLVINSYAGSGEFSTFRIKPAFGVTSTISGNSSSSIIKVNGANNVIIDGSNDGSQVQSLTISNTSNAASTAVVWIAGNTEKYMTVIAEECPTYHFISDAFSANQSSAGQHRAHGLDRRDCGRLMDNQ